MSLRYLLPVAGAAATLLLVGGSTAATPSSGTVSLTSTSTSWQGIHYDTAANVAGEVTDPCPPASLDPDNTLCDHYTVTVDVPPSLWSSNIGGATATISWGSADNDFDLYVYKADGSFVGQSISSNTTSERVVISEASRTYEIRVAPFTVVDSDYTGNVTLNAAPASPAPSLGGPASYHGVVVSGANPDAASQNTPLKLRKSDIPQFQFVDTGFQAAKPTLGVDKTGTAFYAAATFDGINGSAHTTVIRSKDSGLTWQSVQPTIADTDTHPETLDPYVYLEPDSGRVFDIDLFGENQLVGLPLGAELSFSTDQGARWTTSALSIPGLNDHQTLFAGPTPVGNPALVPLDPTFPKVLYFCVNQVADTACAHSLDGGLTWSPTGEPAFTGFDPAVTDPGIAGVPSACGGLQGHLAADGAGRLFLPKAHCGRPWLAISDDGGIIWRRVLVSSQIKTAAGDPAVTVDPAGNVYYVWWDDKHHLAYLSISRDHGATWSAPRMITPPGVYEVNFPTITAGQTGKIALTFPGTPVNDRTSATRPWNSYVVLSTDALSANPTFYSNIANPANDPVYRGTASGAADGCSTSSTSRSRRPPGWSGRRPSTRALRRTAATPPPGRARPTCAGSRSSSSRVPLSACSPAAGRSADSCSSGGGAPPPPPTASANRARDRAVIER
jgi:hypothetical protein